MKITDLQIKSLKPKSHRYEVLEGNGKVFKNIKQFTPNDLRRTAASPMTSIGIPRLVVSKILKTTEKLG